MLYDRSIAYSLLPIALEPRVVIDNFIDAFKIDKFLEVFRLGDIDKRISVVWLRCVLSSHRHIPTTDYGRNTVIKRCGGYGLCAGSLFLQQFRVGNNAAIHINIRITSTSGN